MIYVELFWSFFQVGMFSFGGGMAAMPLIQSKVVNDHRWLTMTQFTDLITIAQMTPGPIAINSATFVGIRIAGIPGAIVATLGCVMPSSIFVLALAWVYNKYRDVLIVKGVLSGLRPAVVALIASAGLTIIILAFWGERGISGGRGTFNWTALTMFAVALFILRKSKINPISIMVICGVIGGFLYS